METSIIRRVHGPMLLVAGLAVGSAACGSENTGSEASTLQEGCESGSMEACSSFAAPSGVEVELGPYGAVMEANVGQGFETEVALGDSDGGLICQGFASIFQENSSQTEMLLDTRDLDFALYSVYRPANWEDGETYPLVTWGNGTCAQPEGYGALLRYVASHGYVVVAANSRWVGQNGAMAAALDFLFAANDDPESPYYQRLDTENVAAMGHSQGAGATAAVSSDARVDTAILFNGVGGEPNIDKPFLTISGDMDLGSPTAETLSTSVQNADQAAFLFYHMIPASGSASGHLTLMTQPERVTEPTVGWLDYMLKDDPQARELFIGDDCGLCGMEEKFEYGQNGLQ